MKPLSFSTSLFFPFPPPFSLVLCPAHGKRRRKKVSSSLLDFDNGGSKEEEEERLLRPQPMELPYIYFTNIVILR